MSRSSPFVITLPDADRAELQRRARCYSAPHAEVVRAKIVLLAADGLENTVIAGRLDVHVGVVSEVAQAVRAEGMAGLGDRQRRPAAGISGRGGRGGQGDGVRAAGGPRRAAVAVVCGGPGRAGRGGGPGGVGGAIDGARWLHEDAIRPWRYRSWIFPRDPDFAVKAGRVLDLYQRIWDGRELGDDEYVLSTDEKSQLQVLSRCHSGLPPGPRRAGPGRVRVRAARHRGLPGRL